MLSPAIATRLLALLLLLAAGCAPTYRLGVQPVQLHVDQPTTEDYAEARADSVSMALRFVQLEPQWLVFEAEYHNDSGRAFDLDPAAFAEVPGRRVGALPARRRVGPGERVPAAVRAAAQRAPWPVLPAAPLPALDPEADIERLQRQADREAAKARRPDWLGLALTLASVGADVLSVTNARETPAQYQTRAVLHEAAWTYNAISSANRAGHAANAYFLADRATQLRDYGLRRGRLQPGQRVRGYVYLPRFDTADTLRVLAPLAGRRVALDFEQVHQRR